MTMSSACVQFTNLWSTASRQLCHAVQTMWHRACPGRLGPCLVSHPTLSGRLLLPTGIDWLCRWWVQETSARLLMGTSEPMAPWPQKTRPASVMSAVTTLMSRVPFLHQLQRLLVVLMSLLLQHLLHQVTDKQHASNYATSCAVFSLKHPY